MEEMYCQSCGMPLVKAEDFATNKDGTPMRHTPFSDTTFVIRENS